MPPPLHALSHQYPAIEQQLERPAYEVDGISETRVDAQPQHPRNIDALVKAFLTARQKAEFDEIDAGELFRQLDATTPHSFNDLNGISQHGEQSTAMVLSPANRHETALRGRAQQNATDSSLNLRNLRRAISAAQDLRLHELEEHDLPHPQGNSSNSFIPMLPQPYEVSSAREAFYTRLLPFVLEQPSGTSQVIICNNLGSDDHLDNVTRMLQVHTAVDSYRSSRFRLPSWMPDLSRLNPLVVGFVVPVFLGLAISPLIHAVLSGPRDS